MDWILESVPGSKDAVPLVLTVSRASAFASELSFTVGNGITDSVLLQPRYTRLLLSLVAAWHADVDSPDRLRGFRTHDEIGVIIAAMPLAAGEVSAYTVKRYVCEIRRSLREAVCVIGAGLVPPDPFETHHSAGYRIRQVGLILRWEYARQNDGARVQQGEQPSTDTRAYRGAPILVHLPVHRAIEASASRSASEDSSS